MRRDRTGKSAAFVSAGVHGILVLALWTTVTIAVRPPDSGPREFTTEMTPAVPLPEPPAPPSETPELILDEEPPTVAKVEEVTPEADLSREPLFAEAPPPPTVDTSILIPSSPSRAAGVLRPRRREPVPVPAPPPPPPPPPRFEPAPAEPAGITSVAAPADGNRHPRYPDRAVDRRWEGVVLLLVDVRADGTVEDVSVLRSSGHAILDRAAIRAVRDWRFAPAKQNGSPVPDQVEQAVRFTLG